MTNPGARPYDVVLMDVQMPVMEGPEATRRLRAQLAEDRQPSVAMTADATAESREQCLPEEAADGDPVDASVLQSLTSRLGERGPVMLERLLGTWETESDKRLGELREAVAAGDAEAVVRVAHALRGGSASLGANRLAEVCGEIESAIRLGRPVDLAQAQARLAAAVAQARAALGQLRVGSAG